MPEEQVIESDGRPAPMPGELVMTRREAAASRMPGLLINMICRIWHPGVADEDGEWWLDHNEGYTSVRESAHVWTVSEAIQYASDTQVFYIEQLAKEAKKDPSKPKRKCSSASYVGSELMDMLKTAPKNATFRAKLTALLKESPPAEADTWEKIKDWIEFNFPKESTPSPTAQGIKINVSVSYNEHGHCDYSANRSGRGEGEVSAKYLMDLIKESDDWDELMGRVQEAIEESAREDIDADYSDEDTSNHEATDEEDRSTDYSRSRLEEMLKEFIKANVDDPDKLEDLGMQ